LKENCFALLAEVPRAETRSGANQAFFVQKRFELRSVIATKKNYLLFLLQTASLKKGVLGSFGKMPLPRSLSAHI